MSALDWLIVLLVIAGCLLFLLVCLGLAGSAARGDRMIDDEVRNR